MSTRWLCTLCGLTALGLAGGALAASEESAGTVVIGAATESVLAAQREGHFAGRQAPYTGPVAERAYKRYLDSFSKPMPEFKDVIGTGSKSGT